MAVDRAVEKAAESDRLTHKRVLHEVEIPDDAGDEPFARYSFIAAELAVRFAVEHHGKDGTEQTRSNHFYVAFGLEDVAQNRSRHESDADRHWESGGEADHVDTGDEEKICEIENYAGEEYAINIRSVRRMDIVQEAVGVVAEAAHGESVNQRGEKNSDRVVPVEKLEAVALHAFIRIGPRPPTDRSGEHHRQRKAKTLRCEHLAPLGSLLLGP